MVINVQKEDTIMKKNYISPDFMTVALKTRSSVLLNYSNTEASKSATVLSREADFDDEDF